MRQQSAIWMIGLSLLLTASCGPPELEIAGRVTVDGADMDSGTIHFASVQEGTSRGVGAPVQAGRLAIPASYGLAPGKYRVAAQAFKRTGRMVTDPQRGQVPEMAPVPLSDSPQEIEISASNASGLNIAFTSAAHKVE